MARNKYTALVEPRLEEIKEMCLDMSEAQIAKTLGVSKASFERYKKEHPELADALQNGKKKLIRKLKNTLIMKATGFKYTEKRISEKLTQTGDIVELVDTVERYAQPDLGAIHLLLKNLDPEWRNDDQTTVDMKRERLALEKEKTEEKIW